MTNPTLAILWGLTQSLGITVAELLAETDTGDGKDKDVYLDLVQSHHIPEIRSADGKCTLRILGPVNKVADTEWYDMNLDAGGVLESEGHGKGTIEHLSVLDGKLNISIGEKTQIAKAGDTIRYQADIPHTIENKGKYGARALMMVLHKA